MQNLEASTWKGRAARIWKIIQNPERYYDDQIENLTAEERKLIDQGLNADKEKLGHVFNMFQIGDETGKYSGTR